MAGWRCLTAAVPWLPVAPFICRLSMAEFRQSMAMLGDELDGSTVRKQIVN